MVLQRDLIEEVRAILEAPPNAQLALVRAFQQRIWDSSLDTVDPEAAEILGDLAYDLEFFVADPEARAEDASYYGYERLRSVLAEAVGKLSPADRQRSGF